MLAILTLNKKIKTEVYLCLADVYSPCFVYLIYQKMYMCIRHTALILCSMETICIERGIRYSTSVKSNLIHIKVNLLTQK